MTFKQIQDEILNTRFSEAERTSCKRWINTCEGKVWTFAPWSEKSAGDVSLTITSGSATAPLPAGITWNSQALRVFDNYGYELDYMEPDSFYQLFEPNLIGTAFPGGTQATAWTITVDLTSGDPVFRFGPTPQSSATYKLVGWNLPIHRDTASTWAPGVMTNDGDLQWWPDGYEGFLIDGAMALGLKRENDPTWQSLESEFNAGLVTLRNLLLSGIRSEPVIWGVAWQP